MMHIAHRDRLGRELGKAAFAAEAESGRNRCAPLTSLAFRKSTGTSNSRYRRVQLLHLIALDARRVQDKYSSRECGIGSGSVRECGFDRRAFLSESEGGIQDEQYDTTIGSHTTYDGSGFRRASRQYA